jgi:hypothetical protein
VCLVVLGRHVPQLGFLDVLLGDEPALSPPELLYRQLLMGDPNEATERAERFLRDASLAAYYDQVAIPALALAETDRTEGRLAEEQRVRVGDSAMLLVDNLAEWEGNGEPHEEDAAGDAQAEKKTVESERVDLSTLKGLPVLVAGARGELDDAAAAMLAQLLERAGAIAGVAPHEALQSAGLREADLGEPTVVVLSYMNADSLAHARFLVRRMRRRFPNAKIITGFWTFPDTDADRRDPLEATRADAVARSLQDALRAVATSQVPEELRGDQVTPAAALRAVATS